MSSFRFSRFAVILSVLLIGEGLPTPAATARAAPRPEDRVVILDDAATDYALRIRMIDQAKRAIDLIAYHQDDDPVVGRPLLEALRRAAMRGVKVRMIRSFFASYHSDRGGLAARMLNDDALRVRPELITYGRWWTSPIPGPNSRMWNTFDEKILVVDGERAIAGGRGQGSDYLEWKDSDLYLEGPAVGGLSRIFALCWEQATKDFGHTRADPLGARAGARHADRAITRGDSPRIAAKAADAAALQEEEPGFKPRSVSLYYHPLLRNLHLSPRGEFELLPDAILERFIHLAKTSRRILFYSHYPAQDPRLTIALEEAAARGARIELITNSLASARNLDKLVWPYDAGIPTQVRLARAGARIHQWVPSPRYRFMHQKLAIFDDRVLAGSHNFNWSSTHAYDELDLDIEDPALADALAARFELEAAEHGRPASLAFLEDQERRYGTGILLSGWFLGFY